MDGRCLEEYGRGDGGYRETMEAGRERPKDDLERMERSRSASSTESDDPVRGACAVSFNETTDRSLESAGPARGEERRGFPVVLERVCTRENVGNESRLLGWGAMENSEISSWDIFWVMKHSLPSWAVGVQSIIGTTCWKGFQSTKHHSWEKRVHQVALSCPHCTSSARYLLEVIEDRGGQGDKKRRRRGLNEMSSRLNVER